MANEMDSSLWSDDFRHLWKSIRTSTDEAYVVSHLDHPHVAIRLAVADWFRLDDAHWAFQGVTPSPTHPVFGTVEMPDDVATALLADPDPAVVGHTVCHVRDPATLVAVILDPATDPTVIPHATTRLLALRAVDDLLAAAGTTLPPQATRELARYSTNLELLDELLDRPDLRIELLANPALGAAQLRHLIGYAAPGRPDGTPTQHATLLEATAAWFTDHAVISNPGGFESSELRECGPYAGVLFGTAPPLCHAAADAVLHEDDAPTWVSAVLTWALELTRVTTNSSSIYPRLGISPESLGRDDVPDIVASTLTDGARAARDIGAASPPWRELADGAATFLDGLAAGGSLQWLRHYGSPMGYGDYQVFEILALRSAIPVLDALDHP